MEVFLAQYTKEPPINLWKICPIFLGKVVRNFNRDSETQFCVFPRLLLRLDRLHGAAILAGHR